MLIIISQLWLIKMKKYILSPENIRYKLRKLGIARLEAGGATAPSLTGKSTGDHTEMIAIDSRAISSAAPRLQLSKVPLYCSCFLGSVSDDRPDVDEEILRL